MSIVNVKILLSVTACIIQCNNFSYAFYTVLGIISNLEMNFIKEDTHIKCKYYFILYKRFEHSQILASAGVLHYRGVTLYCKYSFETN